ncbi:MAG: WD40 repeat domain-containing protein, partial [Candidatus Nanoarchaeia archaeon]
MENNSKAKISVIILLFLIFGIAINYLPYMSGEGSTEKSWQLEDTLTEPISNVYDVDFSPDSQYLAASSYEKVYIYNADDFSYNRNLSAPSYVHTIKFSPDSQYLAFSGSISDYVWIYNTTDWSDIGFTPSSTSTTRTNTFSNDGNYFGYGSSDKYYIHNVSNWNLLQTIDLNKATDTSMLSSTFSPDSQYLAFISVSKNATGSYSDEEVYIYNTSDWSQIINLTEISDVEWYPGVSFSPDGDYLAYGSGDNKVYVHNTTDWSLITSFSNASDNSIKGVSFSPDGDYLAYGSGDNKVYVHNTTDWSLITSFSNASDNSIKGVSFSPDGDYLAYGSGDN